MVEGPLLTFIKLIMEGPTAYFYSQTVKDTNALCEELLVLLDVVLPKTIINEIFPRDLLVGIDVDYLFFQVILHIFSNEIHASGSNISFFMPFVHLFLPYFHSFRNLLQTIKSFDNSI